MTNPLRNDEDEAKTNVDRVAETEIGTILPNYLTFNYLKAVIGKEIYNYWGKRVVEHTTSNGDVLALKVNTPDGLDRSQADMMHFAATHGVLAPKVRGVYDIMTKRPIARIMISE